MCPFVWNPGKHRAARNFSATFAPRARSTCITAFGKVASMSAREPTQSRRATSKFRFVTDALRSSICDPDGREIESSERSECLTSFRRGAERHCMVVARAGRSFGVAFREETERRDINVLLRAYACRNPSIELLVQSILRREKCIPAPSARCFSRVLARVGSAKASTASSAQIDWSGSLLRRLVDAVVRGPSSGTVSIAVLFPADLKDPLHFAQP